jgi:hypothetical protein
MMEQNFIFKVKNLSYLVPVCLIAQGNSGTRGENNVNSIDMDVHDTGTGITGIMHVPARH